MRLQCGRAQERGHFDTSPVVPKEYKLVIDDVPPRVRTWRYHLSYFERYGRRFEMALEDAK